MAAVGKIIDPQAFADRVLLHSVFSPVLGRVVVMILPWLELTCGLCLALGYAAREAAAILAVLLVAFVGYLLLAPADQDCGCFLLRPSQPIGRPWHVAGNLLLLLCTLPVLRGRRPG